MKKAENIKDRIKNIPIPLPPIPKEYADLKKKYIEVKIDKTGFKKPNLFLKNYLVIILVGLFNIFGVVFLFMIREQLGILFLIVVTFYIGIGFPLQLGLIAYTVIRVFLDKNKITNEIKKVLPVSFIIANFFLTQKRIERRVCILDSDGVSFRIGKKRYIIDAEKIFYDDDKFPNGYWLPNLPNQLGFDFSKEFKRITEKMRNTEFKAEDLENEKGEMVDVTYSSANLEIFRKNKVFKEFHEQTTPESMKLVFLMVGILALVIIVGFVLILVLRG